MTRSPVTGITGIHHLAAVSGNAQLTLDFYRRNCIEGLFLSSGIIRSADYTLEQVVEVARVLREEHDFRGYIHLKTIPDADPELVKAFEAEGVEVQAV